MNRLVACHRLDPLRLAGAPSMTMDLSMRALSIGSLQSDNKRSRQDLDHISSSPSKRLRQSLPPTPDSLPLTPPSTTKDPRPLIYHCTFSPCIASFTRPCRLAEHERSHTGERPFACQICQKTFSRDYHLSRHLTLSHTDKRDYPCGWNGCEKAFATAQRKNEHEKTHFQKKEFTCNDYVGCAAVFRKKSTLAVHIKKIHLGIKPFACDQIEETTNELCAAGYETAGKLREHIKRCHSGVPRFYCSTCKVSTSNDSTALEASRQSSSDNFLGFKTLHDLLAHKRQFHATLSKARGRQSNREAMPKLAKPRRKANQHTANAEAERSISVADLLTGTPTPMSEIPCLKLTCSEVFLDEETLSSHCCNSHGMAEVEIVEGLRERGANEGGVFWVGAEYDEIDEEEEEWFNALVNGLQQSQSDNDKSSGYNDHDMIIDPTLE